jgi:hypothetical protein
MEVLLTIVALALGGCYIYGLLGGFAYGAYRKGVQWARENPDGSFHEQLAAAEKSGFFDQFTRGVDDFRDGRV